MKGGVGGSYKISLAIHALYVGNPLKLGPRAENREGGDPMKKSGNQFFKMNSSPVPLQFPACLPLNINIRSYTLRQCARHFAFLLEMILG